LSAKIEKLDSNKAKLSISVSAEDFGKSIDAAYRKQKGRFNIPGFRKGNAPRAIIENFYGKHIFYEDAFEEAFPQSYTVL
jgi:trigger factor